MAELVIVDQIWQVFHVSNELYRTDLWGTLQSTKYEPDSCPFMQKVCECW